MARSEFHDVAITNAGVPISGASVSVYNVNSDGSQGSLATIYTTESGGTKANPFTTAVDGFIDFWATTGARYNVVVSAAGFGPRTVRFEAAWTPITISGSGHFVGQIIEYSGRDLPAYGSEVWAWGDGSAISRTTYATLMDIVAPSQNGTRGAGNPVISALSSTVGFSPGQPVEGTGIPTGATILSVDSASQITLNQNASSGGTAPIRVFLWGNGNGTTTFNLPDLRSRSTFAFSPTGGHIDTQGVGQTDGASITYRRPKHRHSNGTILSGAPGVGSLVLPNHAHGHTFTLPNHTHKGPSGGYLYVTGLSGVGAGGGGGNQVTTIADAGVLDGANPTTAPSITGGVGSISSSPSIDGAPSVGSLSASGLIGSSTNDVLDAVPYATVAKPLRIL